MRHTILATSAAILLAGCASTAPVVLPKPETPPVVSAAVSKSEQAMATASELAAAGNEQVAIDRLTQALGLPDLTDEERARLLMQRGQLRAGAGNNLWGAVADFQDVADMMPGTTMGEDALAALARTQAEATALNMQLETAELTRSERFEALFRLGRHDDAVDLLMAGGVTAQPETLLDLYQIGYLCEGDSYTGTAYDIVEPDGTARTVRFCDLGK